MKTCLFAIKDSNVLGQAIADALSVCLSEHEEIDFEDGEHKIRPLVDVQDRSVMVIHSLYGEPGISTNDKLCRLLFFVGALKDSGASKITVLVPYLCYSRKDRRSEESDPVCTRYLAQMLEAVGTDAILTMDVHNAAAFQNAHRIPNRNLSAQSLFVQHFAPDLRGQDIAVVSPDSGGVKRSEVFRTALQEATGAKVSKGFVEKLRKNEKVWGHTLVGDVKDKVVVMIDDMIASGTTLAKAAEACKEMGALKVYAGATHGVFNERSDKTLSTKSLDRIVITDSIPPLRIESKEVKSKLEILSSVGLWTKAISGDRFPD